VESFGSKFVQTHCVFPNYFDTENPLDVECTAWVPRNLEATALLGAPVTVMHPIAPPGLEYDREGSLIANRDYFRKVGDMAAEFGIKIAVENMLSNRLFDGTIRKRCCTSSEKLLELVDAIDHPNVGVCLDVGHLHYMREPIGAAIRACADKLIAFHIADNDTWNDSHVPPYCGSIDWEEVYQAVRDINYQGGGMLECHACWTLPQDMQRKCIEYMNGLCEFMMEQMGGDNK
jgi:sugar phosphate isomerase/epimerase